MEKKVSLTDFESNPNIGIYMFVNDKFALLGHNVTDKKKKELETALNVPIYQSTILGTELVGLFVSGNNEFLIIPKVFDYELEELNKIAKEHSVKLVQIENLQNTYGNNICVGKDEVLVNSSYSKSTINKIEKETKLKVLPISSSKFNSIGSTAVFLNGKYFLSQEYNETEVKEIIDKIAGIGSINAGSDYISSGVVGNKFGVLIGSQSSTIEIQNIVESLDYL